VNPAHSKAVRTTPVNRITPGAILTWLLFSLIATAVGNLAFTHAGRLYDFRAFYASGWILLHHPTQLFNLSVQQSVQNAVVYPTWVIPFYHPAYESLLYAAFNVVSYRAAYFTYIGCNLALLGSCYLLAPPASDRFLKKIPRPALIFLSFPALICVVEGQDSIIFLFLLCLIWRKLEQGSDTSAGIFLALALFKLQIVLSLTLLLALSLPLRRAKQFLTGFLPAAGALGGLCIALTGISGTAQWIRLLRSAAVASHLGRQAQEAVAIVPRSMPSLNGLLYISGTRLLPPHSALTIDIITSVLLLSIAVLLTFRAPTLPVAFSVALVTSLLLASHLFIYDYLAVIFPLLLLKGRLLRLIAALYFFVPILLFSIGKLGWTAVMAVIPIAILLVVFRELRQLALFRTNIFRSEIGLHEENYEVGLER